MIMTKRKDSYCFKDGAYSNKAESIMRSMGFGDLILEGYNDSEDAFENGIKELLELGEHELVEAIRNEEVYLD